MVRVGAGEDFRHLVVAVHRPICLIRAGGTLLVACSLDELLELVDCANAAGDPIEFVHAYYAADMSLHVAELERSPGC